MLFDFIWWLLAIVLFYCLAVLGCCVLFRCDFGGFWIVGLVYIGWLVYCVYLCCFVFAVWFLVWCFVLLCNSVVCLRLRCSDLHLTVVFLGLICFAYVGKFLCRLGLFSLFWMVLFVYWFDIVCLGWQFGLAFGCFVLVCLAGALFVFKYFGVRCRFTSCYFRVLLIV